MSTTERDHAAYAMARTEAEAKRLIQQAEGIREFTRRFFLSAGIEPGMRVTRRVTAGAASPPGADRCPTRPSSVETAPPPS